MRIFFWFCWICDVMILLFFLQAFLTSYLTGVMDSKSSAGITGFILVLAAVMGMVISAPVLYNNQWRKTAALLASIPFLSLFFTMMILILAFIAGARIN